MKRRGWIAIGGAGLVIMAALFAFWVFSKDAINYESFWKIQDGMAEADIVLLLGRSADEITYSEVLYLEMDQAGDPIVIRRTCPRKIWRGNNMNISVAFNGDGTTVGHSARLEEVDTMVTRIRQWLGIGTPNTSAYLAR